LGCGGHELKKYSVELIAIDGGEGTIAVGGAGMLTVWEGFWEWFWEWTTATARANTGLFLFDFAQRQNDGAKQARDNSNSRSPSGMTNKKSKDNGNSRSLSGMTNKKNKNNGNSRLLGWRRRNYCWA
jgi:hypothetical protein